MVCRRHRRQNKRLRLVRMAESKPSILLGIEHVPGIVCIIDHNRHKPAMIENVLCQRAPHVIRHAGCEKF